MSLLLLLVVALVAFGALAVLVVALRSSKPDVIDVRPPAGAVVQGSGPIHDLLRAGKTIEAIKHYRELTGSSLLEAKTAIDALQRGQPVAIPLSKVSAPPGPVLEDAQLKQHLAHGQLIDAVKRYRELTGLGLKEAKDAVESLRDSMKS